jgi:hypothetical protein
VRCKRWDGPSATRCPPRRRDGRCERELCRDARDLPAYLAAPPGLPSKPTSAS